MNINLCTAMDDENSYNIRYNLRGCATPAEPFSLYGAAVILLGKYSFHDFGVVVCLVEPLKWRQQSSASIEVYLFRFSSARGIEKTGKLGQVEREREIFMIQVLKIRV